MWYVIKSDELCHHGTKGQKWGLRRYQNLDGSLTPEGRARYGRGSDGRALTKYERKKIDAANKKRAATRKANAEKKAKEEADDEVKKVEAKKARNKKIAIAGASAAGVALIAVGGYKLHKSGKITDVGRMFEKEKSDKFGSESLAEVLKMDDDKLKEYKAKNERLTAYSLRKKTLQNLSGGKEKTTSEEVAKGFSSLATIVAATRGLYNSVREKNGTSSYNGPDPSSMSDADLRASINRMQMENQYKDLMSKRISSAANSRGKSKVDSTLRVIGDTLTTGSKIANQAQEFERGYKKAKGGK